MAFGYNRPQGVLSIYFTVLQTAMSYYQKVAPLMMLRTQQGVFTTLKMIQGYYEFNLKCWSSCLLRAVSEFSPLSFVHGNFCQRETLRLNTI